MEHTVSSWPPASPEQVKRNVKTMSPTKTMLSPSSSPKRASRRSSIVGEQLVADGEEDEALLQLQLKEIQTKMELIRARKRKRESEQEEKIEVPRSPEPQRVIQVPSPAKMHSPSRVRMGVDKGKTGKDISLKPAPKGPSFTERLMSARQEERREAAMQKRRRQNRLNGFHAGQTSSNTHESAETAMKTKHTKSASTTNPSKHAMTAHESSTNPLSTPHSPSPTNPASCNEVDPYSRQEMNLRFMSDEQLRECLSGMRVLLVPHMLKLVIPPKFEPPDEDNYVLAGIVAQKSPVLTTARGSKYCIITLTDLKSELDCFLFGRAFERYWKVQTGTIVTILNPDVLKPADRTSYSFSLKLDTDGDSLLEIGRSKHLGHCTSRKKDGKTCNRWVDKRSSEVCRYHVDMAFDRSVSRRMEFSNATFLRAPASHRDARGRAGCERKRYYAGTEIVLRSGGQAASTFFDDEDAVATEVERKERYRRQMQKAEQERRILERLSQTKGSILRHHSLGLEYLRMEQPGRELGVNGGDSDRNEHSNPAAAAAAPSSKQQQQSPASSSTAGTAVASNASAAATTASPTGVSDDASATSSASPHSARAESLVRDGSANGSAASATFRVFSAKSLRRIGFDPTQKSPYSSVERPSSSRALCLDGLRRSSSDVRLSPLKNVKLQYAFTESDDDDDLEII